MSAREPFLDPLDIVRRLAALPHRGATRPEERRAADLLAGQLEELGAVVERQPFRVARTYVGIVWWLMGGVAAGLLLIPLAPWAAFTLVALCAVLTLLYFDWRPSPASLLPPRGTSENVIGRGPRAREQEAAGGPRQKLILMAHYDSAPVSLLYLPWMVGGLQRGLRITMALMAGSVAVALVSVVTGGGSVTDALREALALCFLLQGFLASFDYLRHGYTSGAADNASGTAAALGTFERLMRSPVPGQDLEVVLTGAEEVLMAGARAYLRAHRHALDPGITRVLNFDSLGAGRLRIITRTGSLTPVVYDNPLVEAALETASRDPRFGQVTPARWHTGDFDTLCFARASIPSLTLAAMDGEGRIPHLHRPTDTIENLDPSVARLAVDFAEATARRLASPRPL